MRVRFGIALKGRILAKDCRSHCPVADQGYVPPDIALARHADRVLLGLPMTE